MGKKRIFVIADIHFGKLDPVKQLEDLDKYFFSHCKTLSPDVIVIAGDIMDERVSVNTTTAAIFHKFIDKLIDLNTRVLIIEGTRSHDNNQINIFSHKVSDKFKVYKSAVSDYIEGMKFLIIPEEYMTEPGKYYKKFLKDKYDFCFGHGMFSHISYLGKKSKLKKLTAPVWDYKKDFEDIISGRVVFGHIHTHERFDKFCYVGSFGRYNHGEEEPKGFMYYEYDNIKKKIINEKFIENKNSDIFRSVNESSLPEDRNSLIKKLKDFVKTSYRLRIILNREIDKLRKSDIISFCKNNLNTSIDNKYDKKKNKLEKEDSILSGNVSVKNKYEDMDIVDATVEFVFENKGIKLDKELVIKTLNDSKAL